ncbi:hypothetical protein [uncultured Marivita sp.]|uniref:hypothetical protein n=1 Tax=Aliiroseovarius sp. PTFE2010 TaxID=3417190 RepID=UPI00260D8D08|nr:hypothetical protein [uncultured Marivita sp.]
MTPASVTDLPPVFDGIETVCFDAFGTLVEITDWRGAFVLLFRAQSGNNQIELKNQLMREDRAVFDWPDLLSVEVSRVIMEGVHRLVSVAGCATVMSTWRFVRPSGVLVI